ncbi:MAG: hypothetical protein KF773_11575 [Deltaproteobacteria bacterium]|nr:hypothetical protein [Deltaproteobacteria bacterium]MCW5808055.1 hypothetical protein [Deltaproteobacteria bacterium]
MKALPFALAACLAACGSPIEPSITIESVTPESLTMSDDALDDLTIVATYADGDGDLGEGVARIHDCRADGLVTELPIPAIAPEGIAGEKRITGTLELHVNDIGAAPAGAAVPAACRDLGITEMPAGQAIFCVVLVDAAGHAGPGDCTQAVALVE